jgi:hypothetical protein
MSRWWQWENGAYLTQRLRIREEQDNKNRDMWRRLGFGAILFRVPWRRGTVPVLARAGRHIIHHDDTE